MRYLLILLAFAALSWSSAPLYAADDYKEVTWEALIPKGWDPYKDVKALDLAKLSDNDPKATEALQKMRDMWDKAPTEPSLQGQKIRLPGFAIPLEKKGDKVTEFLLVPYFGACIHTPPPPANQIVHGVVNKTAVKMSTMDPVWISGTMHLQASQTPWGGAGYRLAVDKVVPYKPVYKGSRLDLF
jgi:hypothetical protein